jgi:methyl-accepting chemotaxis protein
MEFNLATALGAVGLVTIPSLMAEAEKGSDLQNIIDYSSHQNTNWWLAGISIIALFVLGYVGRLFIKGYKDIRFRLFEKEKEQAQRDDSTQKLLKDLGDQLANVNQNAIQKLSDVTVEVTRIVTRNTGAMDYNSEQCKELIRAVDKMDRTVEQISSAILQIGGAVEQLGNSIRQQREEGRRPRIS